MKTRIKLSSCTSSIKFKTNDAIEFLNTNDYSLYEKIVRIGSLIVLTNVTGRGKVFCSKEWSVQWIL